MIRFNKIDPFIERNASLLMAVAVIFSAIMFMLVIEPTMTGGNNSNWYVK